LTSKREQFYKRRIAELEKQVAELLKANKALIRENAELTEQVTRLTDKIAKLSKNSSNSSKPPSSDIVKPPKPKQSDGPRHQGGQVGHKGISRQPFGPDRIDKTIPLYADSCDCGYVGPGQPIDQPKIQQTVELVDKPVTITEYHLYGFICPVCGRIVWAKPPAGVIKGQLFQLRLQALIGYMKGSLHASYSALEYFCREVLNIDVARSHLCNTISRSSDAIAAPYKELQLHIPTEPVLNIDESGWKDKGIKYWIWIFCTSAISFFYIAKSRSSQVLRDILGETYNGTIVSDFFSAYVKYANKIQQFCLAHLIRDIKFLTTLPNEADKHFGKALLTDFKWLFHIWHLRDKIPKDRFDRIMPKIRNRILTVAKQQDLPPKSATISKRFRKHGDAMFRFLFDPAVPPTNNAAEQTLRQAIIDRRITQGSRSLMGRQWNARIWTVLATCRKQRRSSWQFFQNALSAYYFQTPTPSLLPQPN